MDSNYTINGLVGGALPVLAISGSSAATLKTTNAFVVKIDGAVSKIAAATLAAIPATITCPLLSTTSIAVYVNAAGTASYVQGGTVLNSSLATNVIYNMSSLPTPRSNSGALVGYVIISCASSATFTGGTTALDAANVTVTYLDNAVISK